MVIVGHGSHHNTRAAILIALEGLKEGVPLLFLVLVGGRHAGEHVLEELDRLFPDIPVVGGSVAGSITSQDAGISGFGISILAFLDPETVPSIFCSVSADQGDFDRARRLGYDVARDSAPGGSAILLYDSVLGSDPPRLHVGSYIAAGFELGLGQSKISFVAAGLLTSANLDDSWLCVGQVLRHAIVALVFPPGLVLESVVLPGSRSTGLAVHISQVDGSEVIELNGRPAYTVVCEALARDPESEGRVLALNVSLGTGNRDASSDEQPGRNRLILSENKERGTITLFEPDFQNGERVEILLQDSEYMLKEIRKAVSLQEAAAYRETVEFCIYFDCAGRSSAFTGSSEEEALVLMSGLPTAWPKLGGYTGVEIAYVDGRYRALDLTGVLAIFRLRQ